MFMCQNKWSQIKFRFLRARHRLLSINHDAIALTKHQPKNQWPWIPNKQCGSWYLPDSDSTITPVYFKSTDGHVGTYNFSLKRLNLHLITILHEHGGCNLVDSSVRKLLPDSFSRTVPIWCCVLNRIVKRYRIEMKVDHREIRWDVKLYTPACSVSSEEHELISNLIDSRVQLLYDSKAIVHPERLVQLLKRPLRARWWTNGRSEESTVASDGDSCSLEDDEYFTIVCHNPSTYANDNKNHINWIENINDNLSSLGYYYTPGAADDDATWGRGLTDQVFWSNREQILNPKLADDDVDSLIDVLMKNDAALDGNVSNVDKYVDPNKCFNKIGNLSLWIGSRKAGRPPECWDYFDAILNVTEMEYTSMADSIKEKTDNLQRACFYLMLPVSEGKKDKSELERWMPVGLCFLIHHLQQKRRVLVHCAQGKDRSVAIVLAFATLACPLEYPLRLRSDFDMFDLERLWALASNLDSIDLDKIYLQSGLPAFAVDALLTKSGRDTILKWSHQYHTSEDPLANKYSLRIGKLSIQYLLCDAGTQVQKFLL